MEIFRFYRFRRAILWLPPTKKIVLLPITRGILLLVCERYQVSVFRFFFWIRGEILRLPVVVLHLRNCRVPPICIMYTI